MRTLTSMRDARARMRSEPMTATPPPRISCSRFTVCLKTKFLTRVRKPETGFCSSFQSEKELAGTSSQSASLAAPSPSRLSLCMDAKVFPSHSSEVSSFAPSVAAVSRSGKRTWIPPMQLMTSLMSCVQCGSAVTCASYRPGEWRLGQTQLWAARAE